MKVLLLAGAVCMLAGVIRAQEPLPTETLLYDLEQHRRVLTDLNALSQQIDNLRKNAPALLAILGGMENSEPFTQLLHQANKQPPSEILAERVSRLQRLVEIGQSLEAISQISPGALDLLSTLEGSESLAGVLDEMLGSGLAGPKAKAQINILFARPHTEQHSASATLQLDRKLVDLNIGDSVQHKGHQYTLKSVNVFAEQPLQLKIQLQQDNNPITPIIF